MDSGRTAAALVQHFSSEGAASVKMASLLSKPARRVVMFEPDYLCFEVEDKFVVRGAPGLCMCACQCMWLGA